MDISLTRSPVVRLSDSEKRILTDMRLFPKNR